MNSRRPQSPWFIPLFLGPPLLIYAAFVVLPAINAFRYSLTRWDGFSEPRWVGFQNFQKIASSGSDFSTALGHNVFLMLAYGSITLTLALYFSYAIHQKVRAARLFRVTFFFPNVMSSVAVALLWTLIYSTSDAGLINNLLRHTFLGGWVEALTGSKPPIAFSQADTLLKSIVPMSVWTATGFYMVLFLAAMENIPESFYEAARLDGAGSGHQFRRITLPLMWDVLSTGIIFIVINGLKFFDAVWVMENGRPTMKTHTISTLMYSKVFDEYNIGFGTAIAVCLFGLVLLATLVSKRLLYRESLEY